MPLKGVLLPKPIKDVPGKRGGITGRYYRNMMLRGKPGSKRIDEKIWFTWGAGPAANVPVDRFSIEWKGYIRLSIVGRYFLCTRSDDGVRLNVGGKRLIDDWNVHAPKESCAAVQVLGPGWYPIWLRHFDLTGMANIELYATGPGKKRIDFKPRDYCCLDR